MIDGGSRMIKKALISYADESTQWSIRLCDVTGRAERAY